MNALSFEQSMDQDIDEEKRSVFIDKFEDIGFLDPSGTAAGATGKEGKSKQAGKSPSKKGAKDGANKKPSLRKIVFEKTIYPEFRMNNPEVPPSLIYLPTAELMRKMIKACLKVESVSDCLDKFY